MASTSFSELKRRLAVAIADVRAADQALITLRARQDRFIDIDTLAEPSERAADLLRQAAAARTIEQQARASAAAAHQIAEPWLQRQADIEALLDDLDPTPRANTSG